MQAVVLAGGKGTRLRPLTDDLPKPMVPVRGKPFLHYQLKMLARNGFCDILILAGYKGERIVEYFRDGGDLNVRLHYSFEKELLGTGGALKYAEHLLRETFVLLNGDTFLPIDYGKLIHSFESSKHLATIVAYDNIDKIAPCNLRLGPNSMVAAYSKKDQRGMTHLDAGVIAVRRSAVELVRPAVVVSLEEEIFPQLIQRGELHAFPWSQRFYDIGTVAGLRLFSDYLE